MTTENQLKYPALYDAADSLSNASQSAYLLSIRSEYALLIVAAILSMEFSRSPGYYVLYALVFLGALALLLYRTKGKPEQDWYKGRALAESIKTSTWRYCMRAQPFEDAPNVQVRRSEFRNYLNGILEANRHIGQRLPPEGAHEEQVTAEMELIRSWPLKERRHFYLENRVKEQRNWYRNSAVAKRRASRRWVAVGVLIYGAAVTLVLLRIAYPSFIFWPIEPLVVVASTIVGWMQIKKFNELVSAYTLAAFEIGIIQGKSAEVGSEEEFSDFVNEAEFAFSREHTQWGARQETV